MKNKRITGTHTGSSGRKVTKQKSGKKRSLKIQNKVGKPPRKPKIRRK